jgi:hypothetical protein
MKLSIDCKLDDEMKTQKQSPAEEAAAIARLVTSALVISEYEGTCLLV